MILIEDSRQKRGKHEIKHAWWAEHHVQLIRCKLMIGDYALMPSLAKIVDTMNDMSEIAKVVDTKENISEIAQNIGGTREEHQRFIREVKLAQEIGTQLYILVENTDGINTIEDVIRWTNPRTEYSPKCIQGPRLAKAMRTIESRYGCVFMFCHPDEAAETIIDLLR